MLRGGKLQERGSLRESERSDQGSPGRTDCIARAPIQILIGGGERTDVEVQRKEEGRTYVRAHMQPNHSYRGCIRVLRLLCVFCTSAL